MAHVFFNRGTQANLNNLSANQKVDGAFYLTTDTNRLYVGKEINTSTHEVQLVELNQSINIVSSVGQLPTNTTSQDVGQFYYVSGENILCIYTGPNTGVNNSGWTQINPDTALDSNTLQVGAGTATNSARITSTVGDTSGTSIPASIDVIGGTGLNVTYTQGTLTLTPDFDDIAAGVDTTYTLSASGGNNGPVTINLNDNRDANDPNNNDTSVTIAGSGAIGVTQSGSTITIDASTDSTTTVGFNNGVLSVGTVVGDGTSTPGTITPKIKLDATNTTETQNNEYTFNNSAVVSLPVYTKSQVDSAINSALATADAMTYRGTISSSTAASKIGPSADPAPVAGDTYKASEAFTYNGLHAEKGDLIIAGGTDSNITWEVIPSGDDQVIEGSIRTTGITISDGGETSAAGPIAGFNIVPGVASGDTGATDGHITVTGSVSGTMATIKVAQAQDYTAQKIGTANNTDTVTPTTVSQTANSSSGTITYLTGIQTDAYGNIVDGSIKAETLTLVDTHNLVESISTTVADDATNGGKKVTIGASQSDGDTIASGNFTLRSDNITISNSSNVITANLEWGTF